MSAMSRKQLCSRKWLRHFAGFAAPARAGLALLVSLLAGCAAPVVAPSPDPPIVLAPTAPVLPPAAPLAVTRALKRDSAAVQRNARRFVVSPSTTAEAVATVEPLARELNRSLAVMELRRTRRGYRPADVSAARLAADRLARFLRSRPDAELAPGQVVSLPPITVAPLPALPEEPQP